MGRCFHRAVQCSVALAMMIHVSVRAETSEPSSSAPTSESDCSSAETPSEETTVSEKVSNHPNLLVPLADSVQAKKPLFRHLTYPDAWRAAQKSSRPILIYVSMPNCPHCVKMAEQTYQLSPVEGLVRGSFETITVDRYQHAKLVEKLKVRWYPTTVLVAPNNKVLDVIEGYVDAKDFHQRLQLGLATLEKTGLATLESPVQKR